MAIEVPQNKDISEGGKNVRSKGVGFTIRWRRVNRGNVNMKKREQRGVV